MRHGTWSLFPMDLRLPNPVPQPSTHVVLPKSLLQLPPVRLKPAWKRSAPITAGPTPFKSKPTHTHTHRFLVEVAMYAE